MARAFTHCAISPDSRFITLGVHLYALSCLIYHVAILYFTEFYKFFNILQDYYCWGRCVAHIGHTKQDGLIHPEKPISRTLVCIWCYHGSYRGIQVPQPVIWAWRLFSGYLGYKPEHPSTIYVSSHKEPNHVQKSRGRFTTEHQKTARKCQTSVSLYLEEKIEKHTNNKKWQSRKEPKVQRQNKGRLFITKARKSKKTNPSQNLDYWRKEGKEEWMEGIETKTQSKDLMQEEQSRKVKAIYRMELKKWGHEWQPAWDKGWRGVQHPGQKGKHGIVTPVSSLSGPYWDLVMESLRWWPRWAPPL